MTHLLFSQNTTYVIDDVEEVDVIITSSIAILHPPPFHFPTAGLTAVVHLLNNLFKALALEPGII